jgi:glutamate dehydrogenase
VEPFLVHGPNVASVAAATGRTIEEVTRAFFLVGEAAYIDRLEGRLAEVGATTRWHRWALQAVEDDLLLLRRQVAERALAQGKGLVVGEAVAAYLAARGDATARLGRFMRGLALEDASDLAALTVAVRQVRGLAG